MRKERQDTLDPRQPALIVTYGNTTRKHRPLEGDLVVIGRSSCCDIGLVSPEVASIHCVIVKTAEGWRIRDCTGRSGTRVNGKSIQDEALHDGDSLQIGTFSFQLNLPRTAPTERQAPPAPPIPAAPPVVAAAPVAPSQRAGNQVDEAKMLHLKQSRERLARHALNMRRRLRNQPAATAPSRLDADLSAQRAELEQRDKKLRLLEAELTEQDRNLREEFAEVEQQRTELQRFAQESLARKQVDLEQKVEALLDERREQLEAEYENKLAQKCAELERAAASLQERERALEVERRRLEESVSQGLGENKADLADDEQNLRQKQHDLEEQLKQIETLNADLAAAREALRLEKEEAERARQTAQADLENNVREVEAYLDTLWQQCEAHRKRVEEQHGTVVASPDFSEQEHALEIRARELDAFAQHLKSTKATLTQYEQELSEAYQQFHTEYESSVSEAQSIKQRAMEEADAIRRRSEHETPLADTAHDEPRARSAGVEAAVFEQLRQETEKIRGDLTAQLAEERSRNEKAETQLKFLKIDLMGLGNELRQREEVLEHLRAELKEREATARPPSTHGEMVLAAPERLLGLIEKLQKDVAERDGRIRDLNRKLENFQELSDHSEKEAYEAELSRYRIELEQDRVLLNEEIARLQVFRAEVEEARQETELHISRERVLIAREWAEINRLREQVRREHAKLELSDSSASKQTAKVKQSGKMEAVELTPSTPSTPLPPPAPQDLIARLRPASKH